MTDSVETLIVGAGVIGLAVARECARNGQEVLVVDEAAAIGTATSSRNSEVIHAGIYYPPGTLKAELCVKGRQMLYEYCREAGVAAKPVGKLIVATTEAEIGKLKAIEATARANGVNDLVWLSGAEAIALEPELNCVTALLSPSTGIVDVHGFMAALEGEAANHGATIALRTSFDQGVVQQHGIRASLKSEDGEAFELECRHLINCAGHGGHKVASGLSGYDKRHLPPRFLAKGNYCSVSGKSPFSRLVYPIPVPGALGTHLTIDLAGNARLGPNIEWVDKLDYSVKPAIEPEFAKACAPFWPGVSQRKLVADYCGIRPKIHGPDASFADFVVQGEAIHGVKGLVHMFGIESPGLTSSLALAALTWKLLHKA
jgi:L-2-hydroxyglutarate oxidase LhgO